MDTKCAVILAGGQSRRFGRDKTALTWNGELLLARLVTVLRAEAFEVTLLGPPRAHFAKLGCSILPDQTPYEGPLSAIAGAMAQLAPRRMLVVAADMPLLTPEVVRLLWQAAPIAALTCLEGENLPAVFGATACATMNCLLQSGERRLKGLQHALSSSAHHIPAIVWQTIDPCRKSLTNLNFPHDWDVAAEKL